MQVNLGQFELTLEPSGKLAQLKAAGCEPLLGGGSYPVDLGPDRVFESRGWDECFPTIEPCAGNPVMGDLIGLPPLCIQTPESLCQQWKTPRYTATRTFRATSPDQLELQFAVHNQSARPMPFLWASHALFSIAGLQRVRFSDRLALDDFSLDGTCRKVFEPHQGPVRIVRRDCEINLDTDQAWWGIWLNRGGWPAKRPAGFGCLGIEATTSNSDLPTGSVIDGGGRFQGTVILSVL